MNYSNRHLISEVIRGDLKSLENILIDINEVLACEFDQIVKAQSRHHSVGLS